MTAKNDTPARTPRRYVTIPEAAEYLRCDPASIRRMIRDGRLPAYRSGQRLIRIDFNDLDDAMTPFGQAAR